MLVSVFVLAKSFRKKKQASKPPLAASEYIAKSVFIHRLCIHKLCLKHKLFVKLLISWYTYRLRDCVQWILHQHKEMTNLEVLWPYLGILKTNYRVLWLYLGILTTPKNFINQSHHFMTIFSNFVNQDVASHSKINTLRYFRLRSSAQ